MFIHRENVVKRSSTYIIIVLYKEITLKKLLYKMGSKYSSRHIKFHIFSKFLCGVACPLACGKMILFLYEKNNFFHSECNQNIH